MSEIESTLSAIIAHKHQEVAHRKATIPLKRLEESRHFEAPPLSLRHYLLRSDKVGVIAEIKRKSPSGGIFHRNLSIPLLSIGYMQGGASALSILTDNHFFGGSLEDLSSARQCNYCPILRKDFVIDEYQLYEARSFGADVVLLIAACLSDIQLRQLTACARTLSLETLIEIHTEDELRRVLDLGVGDLLGVNQRDLKTLTMNKGLAAQLAQLLPSDLVTVAESGISDPHEVGELRKLGYRGFLIGESFLRDADPARACRHFIQKVTLCQSS